MKETIERLQIMAARATKYNYPEGSNMGVSISDIREVLEFYEKTVNFSEYTEPELNCKGCFGPCRQCKDEPLNAQGITPKLDKIPLRFEWVAIDGDGEEVAHINEPVVSRYGFWIQYPYSKVFQFHTDRVFDMSEIDWTKTLSKRPVK